MNDNERKGWEQGVKRVLQQVANGRGVSVDHIMEEARSFVEENTKERFRTSGMPVSMDDISVFDQDL